MNLLQSQNIGASSDLLLEATLELREVQWSVILLHWVGVCDVFFLSGDLLLDGELVVLGPLGLGSNHEDVVEGNNNRVVVIKVLGNLQLLSQ